MLKTILLNVCLKHKADLCVTSVQCLLQSEGASLGTKMHALCTPYWNNKVRNRWTFVTVHVVYVNMGGWKCVMCLYIAFYDDCVLCMCTAMLVPLCVFVALIHVCICACVCMYIHVHLCIFKGLESWAYRTIFTLFWLCMVQHVEPYWYGTLNRYGGHTMPHVKIWNQCMCLSTLIFYIHVCISLVPNNSFENACLMMCCI